MVSVLEKYCDCRAPGATPLVQPVPSKHWRTSRQWHPAVVALAVLGAAVAGARAAGEDAKASEEDPMTPKTVRRVAPPWDMAVLARPPQVHAAPGFEAEGMRSLFYEGLPYKGKPTRIFAWYGAPKRPAGEKMPAMVLVHGGGGTAFDDWVRLWTGRGYAALSMDTCGCTAGGTHGQRPRHDFGGPPGWGGFDQTADPAADQWMYHAVADTILAVSLIGSFDEVDRDRIGLTGISWGGIVVCIAAGVDPRPKFVAPVYGCGFLDEPESLAAGFAAGQPEAAAKWLGLWDPRHYLARAKMPMLWVSGTNDFAFPLPALKKSYRTAPGERVLSVRAPMDHGQEQGAAPEEIRAMADHLLRGGPPLARVTGQGLDGRAAWATFRAGRPVVKARLEYTCDAGPWQPRKWQSVPADLAAGKVAAALPQGATAWFFTLTDDAGLVVSTEHAAR